MEIKSNAHTYYFGEFYPLVLIGNSLCSLISSLENPLGKELFDSEFTVCMMVVKESKSVIRNKNPP